MSLGDDYIPLEPQEAPDEEELPALLRNCRLTDQSVIHLSDADYVKTVFGSKARILMVCGYNHELTHLKKADKILAALRKDHPGSKSGAVHRSSNALRKELNPQGQ